MDMRYNMPMDGRRLPPRNARGEFRRRRSGRRGDRGMDYADMNYMRGGDYAENQMARGDMRGNYRSYDMGDMARNYDRPRQDYGYGDYGETLSDEELKKFCERLRKNLTEQEKQMFSKEALMQKAKSMGRPMEGFSEKEVEVVAIMLLDDYKKSLGANPDLMVKLAFDWLDDKDAKVRGAEKLAVYYDEIVMGGEDD